MKLIIISTSVFLLMKLAYNIFGVIGNPYWNIAYYVPMYLMVIALLRYVYQRVFKKEKHFIAVVMLYFGSLTLINLVCLVDIALYGKLISGMNRFGIPAVIFISGIIFLNVRSLINKIKKPW